MKQEIKDFIREANLTPTDKLTISSLMESIENEDITEFDDKMFLFEGEPGIGKTYFVEHLIKKIDMPVFFIGPFKFEHKKVKVFKNLQTLRKALESAKEGVVFLDDIQNAIKIERDGMGDIHLTDSEAKNFISLLEHIKRSNTKKYLFMTLNSDSILEEAWLDRIETKIELEEPNEKSKKKYLINKYSKYLSRNLINSISIRTMGYNFRNIDEVIRLAYRGGKGKITKNSIFEAISNYTPTSLQDYNIIHKPGLKFKDIVGNEKLKRELAYLKHYVNNPRFFLKRGIDRSNVIVFSGPPGTGKTFMAKALAGELDVPLINIDGRMLLGRGSIVGINRLVNLSRKFRNCVIFVDEIDKSIGNQMLAEDSDVIGYLEAEIDGIKKKTQAIIIFAMNNRSRFGSAFHDRLPCFNFDYPEDSERREFITKKIEMSKILISEDQIDRLVKETKNSSYRQAERILNNIIFKLIEKSGNNIKRDMIITEPKQVEDSINEILGFVQSAKPIIGVG